MAKNFKQPGDVIALTAPSGGVVSGTPKIIGGIFVVPLVSVAQGVTFNAKVTGVFSIAKTSAQAWTEGQKVYWDTGNNRADTTPTLGPLIGVAVAVAANPSATGDVRLNGVAPDTAEGPQAAIASLTDGTGGTANDALANLADGSTYATDHSDIEDNFADLAAKVNEILAALRAAGVIAT